MRNGQVFTFRVILHDLVRTYDKIYFIVFFCNVLTRRCYALRYQFRF